VFNEKEIPHWFAASVITLIVVVNIIFFADGLQYLIYPEINKSIDIYYKYFALVILAGIMFFINRKNRYLKIIEDCEQLPKSKRKVLGYISILYVTAVFVGFFWVGELIRDYNMIY
jgi:hypothetical protein